jgi:hypothetical protein
MPQYICIYNITGGFKKKGDFREYLSDILTNFDKCKPYKTFRTRVAP